MYNNNNNPVSKKGNEEKLVFYCNCINQNTLQAKAQLHNKKNVLRNAAFLTLLCLQERIPIDEVFEQLKCTREGLSSSEGENRLQIFGPNKLEEKKVTTFNYDLVSSIILKMQSLSAISD